MSAGAGVCLRVPFNRVMIKKTPVGTTEHVDIAGVSLSYRVMHK